jgi:hypothetical protein
MRDSERELSSQLREWNEFGRLETEIQKLTGAASAAGMSEEELDRLLRSWVAQFPRRRSSWIGTEAALADLSNLLNGPGNKKQKAWNQARRRAGWAIDHYVAVASMVTILATLFYGYAYTVFFQKLGITPEQAGLTPPWFLTRSALGGLALTLCVALALYAFALPFIPLRDDAAAQTTKGSIKKTFRNLLIVLGGAAYLVVFALALDIPFRGALFVGAIPVGIFLLTSFRLLTHDNRALPNPRPINFDFDKYLAIFLVPVLPVGLIAAATVTITNAYLYGEKASEGYAVRAPKAFGLPLLGVRAEPALIDWRESSAGRGFPPCALYVDGADGSKFLYDQRSGRTLQVQSDVMDIELRNRADTCDAPFNRVLPRLEGVHRAAVKCYPGDWRTYLSPNYRYQWVHEGLLLDNDSPHPRIFRRELPFLLEGVKCRVVASNYFGTDVAVSRRWHPADSRRRWPSEGSGAPDQRLDDRRSLG